MSTCNRCDRPLKTSKSINEGYGPVCKRKHEEAEAEFLKRQVTIDEELEFQERLRA